jgi:hypothetical protein
MLRIPEFGMQIDAPSDCGLAQANGITLYAPLHGKFGVGITRPEPGDDPQGELDDQYALMAALGPVGDHGATFLNRRHSEPPFIGAIRNPYTEQLYLLIPFNHAHLDEVSMRREIGTLVRCIGFISPAMEVWDRLLRGSVFIAADHYQRQLGSSDSSSREERITFRENGLYERRISSHTSISGGGLSLSNVRDDREQGSWDIVEVQGETQLRLESQQRGRECLTLRRTESTFFLNGEPFLRTIHST